MDYVYLGDEYEIPGSFIHKVSEHLPDLLSDGTKICETKFHKNLGVTFSSGLSWSKHIDEVCSKASNKLDTSIMRTLKYKLSHRSLEILYLSFKRPILESCLMAVVLSIRLN